MITNYNTYITEALENKEHTDLLHFLHEKFTYYREHVDYLKNIWFKVKHNDYVYFEIDIIWFYNRFDYKIIYTLSKQGFNFIITNFIINNKHHEQFSDFKKVIDKLCTEQIPKYLDYHSYPNLHKIMNTKLVVLDYDKFLKEFEEELAISKSFELFEIIDNFNIILWYMDKEKVKEIKNKLKSKYDYIFHAKKFDLI
jgi:hypothetical protein